MDTEPAPLIATVLPPYEGFGPGNAGAIGMIARRLAQTPGFRSLVFGGPQAGTFADVAYHGVPPVRLWPGNVNQRFGAGLLRPLRRLRPAEIEVYNRPELALFLARWLPEVPVILNLQNDPQGMRRARTSAHRNSLLRRLARVVTASFWLRQRMLDGIKRPAGDPFVLSNCLDLSELPPPQPREPLILFVGRIVPEKAPDAFVDACASALPKLPGWRAEMLGADRFRADSPETEFTRCVRAAAVAAGIGMPGYSSHAGVLEAMGRASIVVMPSRWQEPFGLVAIEAMASGAALICSPKGALPEVAGDAAIYADPDKPGALAAAILALASDPAKRAAQTDAGLRRARKFDVPVVTARLASLRREVIGSGRARLAAA